MRRRVAIRAAAKEESDRYKKAKELKKMVAKDVRERQKFESMSEVEKLEHIQNRLEYNLEVLKALEEEFTKEAMARNELVKQLEDEGHLTLSQKIDALKKKFAETSGVDIADMQTNIEEYVKSQEEVLVNKDRNDIVEPVLDEEPASVENNDTSEEVDEASKSG